MKIHSIGISPIRTYTTYKSNPQANTAPISTPTYNIGTPTFRGQDLVVNNVQNSLSEMSKYPKDIEYRKDLLKNAGLNPKEFYKIRSIIGAQEIEDIMKNFNDKAQVYSAGENYTNVKSCKMRANLHMHTIASDGTLGPEILLNKASNYADKVAKNNPKAKNMPFVIAITDHDTTDTAKKVIKLIKNDPEKYKNLRVILGVEMTTFNNIALDITKNPINTHVLVYGIDPNEAKFKNFIDTTKEKKFDIQNKMIDKANSLYEKEYGKKSPFSIEQAQDYMPPLKKGLLGVHNYASIYLKTKYGLENVVLKDEKLRTELEKNNLPMTSDGLLKGIKEHFYPKTYNNKAIKIEDAFSDYLSANSDLDKETIKEMYKTAEEKHGADFNKKLETELEEYKRTPEPKYHYVPDFKDLYNALDQQDGVLIGLAHPLEPVIKIEKTEDKYKFLDEFYEKFNAECKEKAKFSEVYYQSYPDKTKTLQENERMIDTMNNLSEKYNLYKTGSQDTHRNDIFTRY